jgi:phage baseplate assembly protein gpV
MPSQELQSALEFVKTGVLVKGKPVIFSGLSVREYLSDVSSFSFSWRQPEKEFSLKDHVNFYEQNLGAEVEISIGSSFKFLGIIYSISCQNEDEIGVEYEINGKGLAAKLEDVASCDSFFQKPIKDIVEDVIKRASLSCSVSPVFKDKLYYTVQYNQSSIDFLRMLAARYGEWFFYDGTKLCWGKPENGKVTLVINSSLFDWQISGKMVQPKGEVISTDLFSGKRIAMSEALNGLEGMHKAAAESGGKTIAGFLKRHVIKDVQEDLLKNLSKIQLQGDLANSVFVTGKSYSPELRLCTIAEVKNTKGTDQGKYLVTEVHHRTNDGTDYINSFTAIPATGKHPPYTNTELYPVAMVQPAEVVKNEDKDGLDRIKVKFPWQNEGDMTPWLSMMQPHAGKSKGFRFLPEVGDKVLVGFLDDNAERPYVMGGLYNEKEKSGASEKSNKQKFIGTKTGRRLYWNESNGELALTDNVFGYPRNTLNLFRGSKQDDQFLIQSYKDEENLTSVCLRGDQKISIDVVKGSNPILKIEMDADSKKLLIHSDGPIEIVSKESIKMDAPKIELTARDEVKIEAQTKSVDVKGIDVNIEGSKSLNAKGTMAVFEGTAKADFKGGGLASLTAALVKIN